MSGENPWRDSLDTADEAGDERTRVLVVDDQELFRRGLVMVLQGEPHVEIVGEVADGRSAVEFVVAQAPDVVLLDVRLPELSGVETCRAIKEASPATKIVMLTSSDDEADLYDSVKNGASGYLLKDSSIEDVADAVRRVASGQSLITPTMATKLLREFKTLAEPEPVATGARLTEREREVLALMAKGLNNRTIAGELFISDNTVKNHVSNILEKLQSRSRLEAVMHAMRANLLDGR